MLIKAQGIHFLAKAEQQSYDFTLNDFTRDDQYHDLDLSSLIPAGTKAVLLWGAYKSDTADCECRLVQYGHTGTYRKVLRHQHVVNIGQDIDCLMPVDSNRKIKYAFSSVPTYVYINLSVVAYFVG